MFLKKQHDLVIIDIKSFRFFFNVFWVLLLNPRFEEYLQKMEDTGQLVHVSFGHQEANYFQSPKQNLRILSLCHLNVFHIYYCYYYLHNLTKNNLLNLHVHDKF
jgi:hypothetical protein